MKPRPGADEAPKNRAVRRPKSALLAPEDPLLDDMDSPPPGPVSQSVRPPAGPAAKKPKSRVWSTLQLLAGVIVVLAASVSVAWGARRYVTTSPRFAIRAVTVAGTQRRTAEQIATLAGVAIGKNVFTVHPASAEAGILADPWIERAHVVRTLPGTIEIAVTEREAHALCVIGEDLYLVTRDGDLFKKAEGDDPTDLPVITGVIPEQIAKDRTGVLLQNKRVLDVADDLGKVGVARRYPIQELHTNTDGSLVVTIGKEGILLHFGHAPYRSKIEQAARVLNEVARRKASASVIFLDNDAHPERVVVRMK
ncbi:MAG: FtsQ-type POTRA domain-containing protein [Polyangiaceae bacterium]